MTPNVIGWENLKQKGARPAQTRDDIFLLYVIKNGRQDHKSAKKYPLRIRIATGIINFRRESHVVRQHLVGSSLLNETQKSALPQDLAAL